MIFQEIEEDILQVRSNGVNFYVLKDTAGLYLIDSGFIRGSVNLEKALLSKGWEKEKILGILLTHGHLDHILNVSTIIKKTKAWVAAPRLDFSHYIGKPKYSGCSLITGCLETIGRLLLGFRPFEPEVLFSGGDTFDIMGGVEVIDLPGHTNGHSGFYLKEKKLLFSGDLFASFKHFSHLPPHFLNIDSELNKESVFKALSLDLAGVLPNHCDGKGSVTHFSRLKKILSE